MTFKSELLKTTYMVKPPEPKPNIYNAVTTNTIDESKPFDIEVFKDKLYEIIEDNVYYKYFQKVYPYFDTESMFDSPIPINFNSHQEVDN